MSLNAFAKTDDFGLLFATFQHLLLDQPPVSVGEWQSRSIDTPMRELLNVSFAMDLPESMDELAHMTGAHRPWAEDHFEERVGGQPLNPAPSEAWWPFASKKGGTNADHKSEGEAFSHTYPERMWPKLANGGQLDDTAGVGPHQGIRFEYGDLQDLLGQLIRSPLTRQAFLPIWFPEDTGAAHGKRVPCTLGYHFLIRDGKLQITYYMRSTDLLRHFQDDIYLAGRLAQWVVDQLNKAVESKYGPGGMPESQMLEVGELIFHTANLHIFDADVPAIQYRISQGNYKWA